MSDLSFEKALEKLEIIVGEMEDGDLVLEASLKKYEEGVKLSKLCLKHLNDAEKKIEVLKKNADGSFEIEKFDSFVENSDAGNAPRKKTSRKNKKQTLENNENGEDLFPV